MFAENMGKCATVETNILTTLYNILKNCCEFGIDFEIAVAVRRKLQQLLGLSQLPSLNRVTELSSTLLIVGLANFPPPMRELEQWLEFLVDLYLQQLNRNDRCSPGNSPLPELRCERNVIYYNPINELEDDDQTAPTISDETFLSDEMTQEETSENLYIPLQESENRRNDASLREQDDNSCEEIQRFQCKEESNYYLNDQTIDTIESPNTTCHILTISSQQTEKVNFITE